MTKGFSRDLLVYLLKAVLLVVLFVQAKALIANEVARDYFLSQLSSEELSWLEQNPSIVYTGDPDWLPFEAFDKSGKYTGLTADYLKRVSEISGIDIEYIQPSTWSEALELADQEQVQMISAVSTHPKLNEKYSPISPFYVNRAALISRKGDVLINSLSTAKNKKIATVIGYAFAQEVREKFPNIDFVEVLSTVEAFEKVASKELDGVLLYRSHAQYSLVKHSFSDLEISLNTKLSYDITFFISNNEPILKSIIDKALFSISPMEQVEIISSWTSNSIMSDLYVDLSLDEREYLRSISPIKLTGDPDWLPYEAFLEDGSYIGQVAENLQLVEDLLNVEIEKIATTSWSDSLELVKSGQVDILSESDTSVLKDEMLFTRSYLTTPLVIVMSDTEHFIGDLKELKNKTVAVVKDYGYEAELYDLYPELNLVEVDSIAEGLLDVSGGAIDALISNSSQAIFQIERMGLTNIRIVGKTGIEASLNFAIHPSKAPLVPIINKALDKIYLSSQQQAITDKWSNALVIEKDNNSLYLKIILSSLALMAFILFGNYRLKKDIKRRKKIQVELAAAKEQANIANEAKSKFLAVMSHELRTPLNGILGMLELHQKSELSLEQRNTVSIVKESSESLLAILNDILDFSKIEADKMDVVLEPTNLRNLIEICVNAQAQNAYKKGLSLEVYLAPEFDTELQVDGVRLRQIVNNLLSNAIKFTEKGVITVALTSSLESKPGGLDFIIQVEDSGIGITPQDQAKLFKEFVQVDMASNRKHTGTGLGLSICKRLAKLLGGTLAMSSKYGIGTSFKYTQFAEYAGSQKVASKKWSNLFIGLIVENKFTYSALESYLRYFGAETFTPFVIPQDSKSLDEMIKAQNIDLMIIDQALLNEKFQDYNEKLDIANMQVIKLVCENSLSANHHASNVGLLNTNPLQPRYLEMLVDIGMGINKHDSIKPVPRAEALESQAIKILVVEDHPTNQELIARQLKHLDYKFEIVADGEQALEAWTKGGFSGILTDCHMPVMDGYEMTETIRSMGFVDQPIIAMTANAMSGEKEKCISFGMNDLLIKPVDINALESCIEKWFRLNPETHLGLTQVKNIQETEDEIVSLLTERFFGKDQVLPMLETYYLATLQDIKDLQEAVEKSDASGIKTIAHRIKGAASLVFAGRIESISKKLEGLAEQKEKQELLEEVNLLEKQLHNYKNSVIAKFK